MLIRAIQIIFFFMTLMVANAVAGEPETSSAAEVADSLRDQVGNALAKRFSGAKVELTSPIRWTQGGLPSELRNFKLQADSPRGDVDFTVENAEGIVSRGSISFAAWVSARIASRKIPPAEKLQADSFSVQDVNIATGLAREYRSVILPVTEDLGNLESRQTILEGQFLVSNAVQKIPDVRRGDAVRIQVVSGGLTLSTPGLASEPAYVDGKIRVMASKTKRELVGKLVQPGVVEVRL